MANAALELNAVFAGYGETVVLEDVRLALAVQVSATHRLHVQRPDPKLVQHRQQSASKIAVELLLRIGCKSSTSG